MRHSLYSRFFVQHRYWCAVLLLATLAIPAWASERTLLILGDSLSAGYGLDRKDSWPSLLEERLRQGKFNWRTVNASVSGETSAGGRSRIQQAIRQYKPDLLILALGANDGLRGLPLTEMKRNLAAIIVLAKQQKSRILLLGMQLPPNYGAAYSKEFAATFASLAREQRVALVPFMMEGFADQPAYFLPDGLHPNQTAQPLIMETVWRALQPLLEAR